MSARCLLVPLTLLVAWPLLAAEPADDPDERVLREARIGTDGPALLAFFRQRTPTEADRKQLEELIRKLGSDTFREREEATQRLSQRGPVALPLLRKALKDEDAEIRRRAQRCLAAIETGPAPALPIAAARLLAKRRPAGAVEGLLAFAPFADDESVEEAVLPAILKLGQHGKAVDPALTAALRDPNPTRRALAAAVVGRRGDAEQRAIVCKLLKDPEARVRFRAAQGLLAARDREAVPTLIALLNDGPPEIGWRAEELLIRVAAEQSPQVSAGNGSPEARKKWRDGWAKWWADHGAKVDLARVEEKPPFLNLTLVPQMQASKVWECGPDGKPRWEVTNLAWPIDAQVLPGGRILVAEFDGNRVTEHDLKGKVLWQKAVQKPIACQRLPNGNTFIGTNHPLMIVTRDGKEVFTYKPEGGFFIHSVQWLANGHFVCVSIAGTIREIDAAGKVIASVDLGNKAGWSGIEAVLGGRYLVVNCGSGLVQEVDRAGKVVWECKVVGSNYATRLPNGNTLIAAGTGMVEVDRAGKAVWQKPIDAGLWRVHRR